MEEVNKVELKNFAVSARRDLLEKVALRAKIFGIDEKNGLTIEEKFGQLAINGETYPINLKSAFLSLNKQLEVKGYEQLIEEVAYTWFNRIVAITLYGSERNTDPKELTFYQVVQAKWNLIFWWNLKQWI